MISYYNGDLLKSGCNIICHQVNLQGVMGGGIALQIAKKYPECEKQYMDFVHRYGTTCVINGSVFYYQIDSEHIIANCFSQDVYFNTDYTDLVQVFANLKEKIKPGQTIGFPHGYGCGIANGDWLVVEKLIKQAFENSEIDCQIWKYEEKKA